MDELDTLLKLTRFCVELGEPPLPQRPLAEQYAGEEQDVEIFACVNRCCICDCVSLLQLESSHRLSIIITT